MAKICDIIPTFLIPKILAINLPNSDCPDQYIWPHIASGGYSTKSGYRSLYDRQKGNDTASDSLVLIYKGFNFWKLVWTLDLTERIKVVIWKCLKDILSIWSGLAQHMPVSPLFAPFVSIRKKP